MFSLIYNGKKDQSENKGNKVNNGNRGNNRNHGNKETMVTN